MLKRVWLFIPLLALMFVNFPAGAQDNGGQIEVPELAVDGIATMHQYFPAGEWDYLFSSGQSGDVVLTALSSDPHGVVRWVRFPDIDYDMGQIEETINEAWMDGILLNYVDTETLERCVIDDSYLFVNITGSDGNERPYNIHYWVWVDESGWNDMFVGVAPEAMKTLPEFEEGQFEVVGSCEDVDESTED